MNRCRNVILGFSMAAAMLASCASSRTTNAFHSNNSGYCYPAVNYVYDTALKPLDSVSMIARMPVKGSYSRHTIMVANATGVLRTLKDLDAAPLHSDAWWQLHQQIMSRLFLISTEIERMAAELDCEGERADQVATFITQNENQRVKKLTVLSIVSGALAGIGNAALKSHGASVAFAVVGGSISAGLGLSALFTGQKVTFTHPRNLLSDFWNESSASMIYPPAIWYMLSDKFFSNEQKIPIARNMKNRWIAFEGFQPRDRKSDARTALIFGAGGKYDADNLRARARMLNQVQASVKLMNQDLQGLIEAISK